MLLEELSKEDAKRIWKAIVRHLPHIAKRVEAVAAVCRKHDLPPTYENLRWMSRQLDSID